MFFLRRATLPGAVVVRALKRSVRAARYGAVIFARRACCHGEQMRAMPRYARAQAFAATRLLFTIRARAFVALMLRQQ